MAEELRRIAVMTSGGDAPGMNAAIRAVVRTGIYHGLEVHGIHQAYKGLINGDVVKLDSRDVGGIIQRGGTILQTARLPEFKETAVQRKAVRVLSEKGIEALVIVGGDGSMNGALALQKHGLRVIGIPGSIDNDIWGTDSCIGVDTATNTILHAIDNLRDTASSHQRVFIIEVMGRHCGHLAMVAGLVSGAEVVLIPEKIVTLEQLGAEIEQAYLKGKAHGMIIVAEGANLKTEEIATYLGGHDIGFEVRTTILGHVQRGGAPTAFDRLLATRFGVAAVNRLLEGHSGEMVVLRGMSIDTHPLEDIVGKQRPINPQFVQLAQMLTR
jgi:6-phosphofructokinase 1